MFGVFGGLAVGVAGLREVGAIATTAGMSLAILLVVERFLIIPFLKCPSCGDPFFSFKGTVGFLGKLDPHNRKCINCGLSIDDKPTSPAHVDADGQL